MGPKDKKKHVVIVGGGGAGMVSVMRRLFCMR